jgi:hypothetical protein
MECAKHNRSLCLKNPKSCVLNASIAPSLKIAGGVSRVAEPLGIPFGQQGFALAVVPTGTKPSALVVEQFLHTRIGTVFQRSRMRASKSR